MTIILVYTSIHMSFYKNDSILTSLQLSLYISKCVSWASYANKAHRQVKNLWLLIWEKHNREGEIVKTNVKSSKFVTGIFPTNDASTGQWSYFFPSWGGAIIYLTASMCRD